LLIGSGLPFQIVPEDERIVVLSVATANQLLGRLATHELDVVLSDSPVDPSLKIGFNPFRRHIRLFLGTIHDESSDKTVISQPPHAETLAADIIASYEMAGAGRFAPNGSAERLPLWS
jgi:hypothetical protein